MKFNYYILVSVCGHDYTASKHVKPSVRKSGTEETLNINAWTSSSIWYFLKQKLPEKKHTEHLTCMRFTFYRKPGTIRMHVNFLQNYMNVRTSMPTVTASICMCCFGLFLKLPSAHNVLSSQRPFTPSEKEDMRVPFFLLSIDITYSTAHSMKSPTRFIDTCAGSH